MVSARATKSNWKLRFRNAKAKIEQVAENIEKSSAALHPAEGSESLNTPPQAAQSVAHFLVHRGATLFFYGVVEPLWTAQFANAYRFVTSGKTYMSSADIQAARRSLKVGDVIAARNEAAATTNFIEWLGSRWTHVGIYVGEGRVLEALDNAGVVATSLTKFMRRYTRVALYRPVGDWNVDKGLEWGRAQVGKGYNFAFVFNDKSFYCSQLLYRVLREGDFVLAPPRRNRMGYPIVSPDEFIYDNRERFELIWSAGHEIFRDQAEAVAGISKMTGQMMLSILAENGVFLNHAENQEGVGPDNVLILKKKDKGEDAFSGEATPHEDDESLPEAS